MQRSKEQKERQDIARERRETEQKRQREEEYARMMQKNKEAAALRQQKERETLEKMHEQISKFDIEELTNRYQYKYLSVVHMNNKLSADEVVQRASRNIYLKVDSSDENISSKIKFEIAYKILYELIYAGVLVEKPVRYKNGQLKGYYIREGKGRYTYQPKIRPSVSNASLPSKGIDAVDKMDGHRFEEYCAGLLRETGYTNVEVTKGSGDQGVDVIATKDGIKYAIQCKCYSSDLGNTPVQEVNAGKALYKCHVGVVLTNRYFTAGARELAEATGVLLWDRDELMKIIAKAEKL